MRIWNFGIIESAFSDAAINPSNWARALNIVAEQTDAFGAIVIPVSGSHLPNLPFSDRMESSVNAYFQNGWHLRDERQRGASIMMKSGVVDDLDITSFDQIKRLPYYQEFLAREGLRWFAGVKVSCGDSLWCLSIQRSLTQTPFTPEEKQRLAQLSRSVSSAAAAANALGFSNANAALDAFEVSRSAILLIDRSGKIARSNLHAEKLLTGDVTISDGRLVARDPTAGRLFERALHQLLLSRDAPSATPIPMPRGGQRPLLVHLIKLHSLSANAFSEYQAMAIIVDPDKRWSASEATLRSSFGFTFAEARLAARVSSGASLDSVTETLGISKQTGRNQLKSIFAKAGVNRQAELVAMIGSTAAVAMSNERAKPPS